MKPIPLIALLLSGIAVVVAFVKSPSRPAAAETTPETIADQLHEAQQQIAELEASHQRLRQELQGSPGDRSPADSSSLEMLEERVETLTAEQSEMAALKQSIDPFGVIQATEQRIQNARTKLMDASLTPWERAKQAELLKQYGQFDSEAVTAMRDVLNSTEDAHAQSAALVALRGHVTPDMRDEILGVLSTNATSEKPNPRLTYHGIEALEPLLPDPAVQQWMIGVAETNPEPKIANRAATSLGAEIEWETPPAQKR